MPTLLVIVPLLGALAIAVMPIGHSATKRLGLLVSLATLWLSLYAYATFDVGYPAPQSYVGSFGLALDGISLPFVVLTGFLTPVVLLASWNNVTTAQRGFIALQLVTEGLLMLVWVVTDLVSFYVAFEAVLVPLFITVGVWGAASRVRSAFLLFMFTLSGSLLMLMALLTVALNVGSGDFSLLMTVDLASQRWVWLGLFIAFAVKTPMVPFHMWLPRAHADAPLAASMVLAGTVLKLATYGYLRLCLGLMPVMSQWFSPLVQAIGLISLIYSSLATLRQSDMKALIAYSSIGHMAVVVLGLFSGSLIGITGAMLLSLAHGLVSPALFILTGGVLYDRYHTRVVFYYRGLGLCMPVFTTLFLLATVMNMGQPLSLNWVGEFTSLLGLFTAAPLVTAVACLVQVLAACYAIWLYVRMTSGSVSPYLSVPSFNGVAGSLPADVTRREYYCLIYLLGPAIIFGVWTTPLVQLMSPSLSLLAALVPTG